MRSINPQGSNFDDDEKKTTGGRNGYGAKLANIFSKKFIVECLDATHGLKFTQVWRNNMHNAEEPDIDTISSSEKKRGDYVKITFVVSIEIEVWPESAVRSMLTSWLSFSHRCLARL